MAGLEIDHLLQKKHLRLISICFMAFVLMVVIVGCATAPAKKPPEQETVKELVWPAPPSEPVIRYVQEHRSDARFKEGKKTSFKDAVLGAEEENLITLRSPFGVFVDAQGRLLVSDTALRTLFVFDFEKKELNLYGSSGPERLLKPFGAATDRFGRIYIADGDGRKIVVYDQNGNYLSRIGASDEFERPVSVAIDNQRERVYVADIHKHHIAVFDFEGNRVSTIGERGYDLLQFNFPAHVTTDAEGRLYVTDSMNFRIQIIEPDGETVRAFGEQGNGPGQLARPKATAVNDEGMIFVVDSAFGNVQIFNQEGQLLMYFGGFGKSRGRMQLPSGIAIGPNNEIYVADLANNRVQQFEYLGAPAFEEEPAEEAQP